MKITQAKCLATTIRVRNYTLIAGIVMSAIGFLIFLNFSADDFLSPGFVEKGTLLQRTQLGGQEFFSTPLYSDNLKPVSLLISASDSTVAFDIQVESTYGIVFHNMGSAKSPLTFVPDSKGDYLVTIKNLSSKTITVNVSYGYLKNYESNQILFVILSMFLIIGGNYIIVHNFSFSFHF